MEYLGEQRALLAERLLREGELTIHEIASRCAFSDPTAFARAFKKRRGLTPRSFRDGARL
jgi:AraC-like DNA-binding protein